MSQIALVKTDDRTAGIDTAIDLLERNGLAGKRVFLKPNFNSADPAPGSTHQDTLRALIERIQAMGVDHIQVGDRSGMGDTAAVMRGKDVFRMADEFGFDTVVFDELPAEGWVSFGSNGGHWSRGYAVAKPVLDADAVLQACCLKTHRFGGHFTLSLKNSVGLVAKRVPGEGYDYMSELHNSPHQRRMIAEVNAAYRPALILLDGMEAFIDGGPDRGTLVTPGVILAGSDRVAIDAVGVAILRHYGTTSEVSRGSIFEQEQIARAVELGLGVSSPEQIEFITPDAASQEFARQIGELLFTD